MSVKYVERKGTGSRKWDGMWNKFGSDDLIAMWIADMDFELAEPIKNALKDHIDKYPLGYSIPPESYYENFIEWEKKYHGYEVKRDWICFGCGIVAAFNMVVLMLTRPGDAVMTVTPCYYPMQDVRLFSLGLPTKPSFSVYILPSALHSAVPSWSSLASLGPKHRCTLRVH